MSPEALLKNVSLWSMITASVDGYFLPAHPAVLPVNPFVQPAAPATIGAAAASRRVWRGQEERRAERREKRQGERREERQEEGQEERQEERQEQGQEGGPFNPFNPFNPRNGPAVLLGGNSMDTMCAPPWGTPSDYPDEWPGSHADYSAALNRLFGEDDAKDVAKAVVRHYGPLPANNVTAGNVTGYSLLIAERMLNMTRDAGVSCPAKWLADKFIAAGRDGTSGPSGSSSSEQRGIGAVYSTPPRIYLYEFAFSQPHQYGPNTSWFGPTFAGRKCGVT
jgi:hypothetical protein